MKNAFILLVLPWHLLSWSDFKMEPLKAYGIAARSNISLTYDYAEDDNGRIYFNRVDVEFNEDSSFTNTDDPYVLNHEQQHLNIAKIIVDRTNKNFWFHHRYTRKQFDNFMKEIDHERDSIDEKYDKETNHSLNHKEQERWNKWIERQLN
jgi:hypothetical protein